MVQARLLTHAGAHTCSARARTVSPGQHTPMKCHHRAGATKGDKIQGRPSSVKRAGERNDAHPHHPSTPKHRCTVLSLCVACRSQGNRTLQQPRQPHPARVQVVKQAGRRPAHRPHNTHPCAAAGLTTPANQPCSQLHHACCHDTLGAGRLAHSRHPGWLKHLRP